jgi:hypothetical protein
VKKTLLAVVLVIAVVLGIGLPVAVLADYTAIDIEKYVSVDGGATWEDADAALGPTATVGQDVKFMVTVTNTGVSTLNGVVVTDTEFVFTGVATSLAPGESDDSDVVTVTAVAGQHYDMADVSGTGCYCVTDSDPAYYFCTVPEQCCRWTGGGTIGTDREPRVTHGFELHCSVDQLPNNLEVNWGGDHFHLDALTQVECSDDPTIDPRPPRAGCDTIHGWGDGKYDGVSGYLVEFILTDAGEPGRVDWAWIKITNSNGDTVMEVSGFLKSGNQQAHNCTGIDAA